MDFHAFGFLLLVTSHMAIGSPTLVRCGVGRAAVRREELNGALSNEKTFLKMN